MICKKEKKAYLELVFRYLGVLERLQGRGDGFGAGSELVELVEDTWVERLVRVCKKSFVFLQPPAHWDFGITYPFHEGFVVLLELSLV